jgi:hypothetical protein
MRDRLASGQGQTCQDVARWLGVQRHTVGHWLAIDEVGGVAAWLDVDMPAGKPVSLSPAVLDALEQALRQPAGVASYEAQRQ